MPDILQDFPIKADAARIFAAVSTPEGLNQWWTASCTGRAELGEQFELGFGPEYQWSAVVSRCEPGTLFELTLTRADADWEGSRVGFLLAPTGASTQLRFSHEGWPMANEHYRVSAHCWALYLRLLRRYVECGEIVAYPDRLDA